MKELRDYPNCFICGKDNPIGLKVTFEKKDGKARGEYTPSRNFEGYKDVLHGGIISALLDEVMVYAVFSQGHLCVTTHMEVKFRKAAKINEKLLIEGNIVDDRGKLILTEGKILNQEGDIVATGKGKFFKTEGKLREELLKGMGTE
ncbi:PaaI family thioesterase [Acidobacteriota bacterium]